MPNFRNDCGDRPRLREDLLQPVETGRVEMAGRTRQRLAVRLAQRLQPQHARARLDIQPGRHGFAGRLVGVRDQQAAQFVRLAVEPGREARARADRIGEAPALLDERAAALLAAQHALLHQRGDRFAHRVPVDAEAPRQLVLRRQLARAVDRAPLPMSVRMLSAICRHSAMPLRRSISLPDFHLFRPVTTSSWTTAKERV